MQLRTAALVGILGLGLGWAVGTRTPAGMPADGPQGRGGTGPRPLGVGRATDAPRFTEQLRLKLEQQPKAPRPARNPFVFGSRSAVGIERPTRATESPSTAEAAHTAPEPLPPPGSQFRLTGMASTDGPDGPVFTAIVHDGRSLVFVTRGDTLSGGFEVVDVQESTVTLRDSAGGERTLRLR